MEEITEFFTPETEAKHREDLAKSSRSLGVSGVRYGKSATARLQKPANDQKKEDEVSENENLAAHTLDALIRNEPAEAVEHMQNLIRSRAQDIVYDRFTGGSQEMDEQVENEDPDAEETV